MNPVVVVHFLAGLVSIGVALPLIRKKVPMNGWYGIRIPAAFKSDDAWYELNRYGGWLFLVWGLSIVATSIAGALVSKSGWIAYNFIALVVIVGGLVTVLSLIYRHARKQGFR